MDGGAGPRGNCIVGRGGNDDGGFICVGGDNIDGGCNEDVGAEVGGGIDGGFICIGV